MLVNSIFSTILFFMQSYLPKLFVDIGEKDETYLNELFDKFHTSWDARFGNDFCDDPHHFAIHQFAKSETKIPTLTLIGPRHGKTEAFGLYTSL